MRVIAMLLLAWASATNAMYFPDNDEGVSQQQLQEADTCIRSIVGRVPPHEKEFYKANPVLAETRVNQEPCAYELANSAWMKQLRKDDVTVGLAGANCQNCANNRAQDMYSNLAQCLGRNSQCCSCLFHASDSNPADGTMSGVLVSQPYPSHLNLNQDFQQLQGLNYAQSLAQQSNLQSVLGLPAWQGLVSGTSTPAPETGGAKRRQVDLSSLFGDQEDVARQLMQGNLMQGSQVQQQQSDQDPQAASAADQAIAEAVKNTLNSALGQDNSQSQSAGGSSQGQQMSNLLQSLAQQNQQPPQPLVIGGFVPQMLQSNTADQKPEQDQAGQQEQAAQQANPPPDLTSLLQSIISQQAQHVHQDSNDPTQAQNQAASNPQAQVEASPKAGGNLMEQLLNLNIMNPGAGELSSTTTPAQVTVAQEQSTTTGFDLSNLLSMLSEKESYPVSRTPDESTTAITNPSNSLAPDQSLVNKPDAENQPADIDPGNLLNMLLGRTPEAVQGPALVTSTSDQLSSALTTTTAMSTETSMNSEGAQASLGSFFNKNSPAIGSKSILDGGLEAIDTAPLRSPPTEDAMDSIPPQKSPTDLGVNADFGSLLHSIDSAAPVPVTFTLVNGLTESTTENTTPSMGISTKPSASTTTESINEEESVAQEALNTLRKLGKDSSGAIPREEIEKIVSKLEAVKPALAQNKSSKHQIATAAKTTTSKSETSATPNLSPEERKPRVTGTEPKSTGNKGSAKVKATGKSQSKKKPPPKDVSGRDYSSGGEDDEEQVITIIDYVTEANDYEGEPKNPGQRNEAPGLQKEKKSQKVAEEASSYPDSHSSNEDYIVEEIAKEAADERFATKKPARVDVLNTIFEEVTKTTPPTVTGEAGEVLNEVLTIPIDNSLAANIGKSAYLMTKTKKLDEEGRVEEAPNRQSRPSPSHRGRFDAKSKPTRVGMAAKEINSKEDPQVKTGQRKPSKYGRQSAAQNIVQEDYSEHVGSEGFDGPGNRKVPLNGRRIPTKNVPMMDGQRNGEYPPMVNNPAVGYGEEQLDSGQVARKRQGRLLGGRSRGPGVRSRLSLPCKTNQGLRPPTNDAKPEILEQRRLSGDGRDAGLDLGNEVDYEDRPSLELSRPKFGRVQNAQAQKMSDYGQAAGNVQYPGGDPEYGPSYENPDLDYSLGSDTRQAQRQGHGLAGRLPKGRFRRDTSQSAQLVGKVMERSIDPIAAEAEEKQGSIKGNLVGVNHKGSVGHSAPSGTNISQLPSLYHLTTVQKPSHRDTVATSISHGHTAVSSSNTTLVQSPATTPTTQQHVHEALGSSSEPNTSAGVQQVLTTSSVKQEDVHQMNSKPVEPDGPKREDLTPALSSTNGVDNLSSSSRSPGADTSVQTRETHMVSV